MPTSTARHEVSSENRAINGKELLDFWKIASKYNELPKSRQEQTALIKKRYGENTEFLHGLKIDEMHDSQIYSIANNVFERAHYIKSNEFNENDIPLLDIFLRYEDALKIRSSHPPLTRMALSYGDMLSLNEIIEWYEYLINERFSIQSADGVACIRMSKVYEDLQKFYNRKR